MKNLFACCFLLLCCSSPLLADDVNAAQIKGHASVVEIVKNTSSGAYLWTDLFVWTDAGGQLHREVLLRCNGSSLALSDCLYPSSFLNCSIGGTTTIVTGNGTTIYRHFCDPTNRDAGECVDLTARIRPMDQYIYSIGGPSFQALALDVTVIGYASDCDVK